MDRGVPPVQNNIYTRPETKAQSDQANITPSITLSLPLYLFVRLRESVVERVAKKDRKTTTEK